MSDPRYPIGKFSYAGSPTAEKQQQNLTDIEQHSRQFARRPARTLRQAT